MILIAYSGSESTTWSVIHEGKEILKYTTEPYNPGFVSPNYIIESLAKSLDLNLRSICFQAIHYYGEGCEGIKINIMKEALRFTFVSMEVFVYPNMLAVGRAILGDKGGFVAALGMATHIGIYDGENIVQNIDPLGLILGDAGSGGYLGKRVVRDYLRGQMPLATKYRFEQIYYLKDKEILYNMHSLLEIRRYSTFSQFLQTDCMYSVSLIRTAFRRFFTDLRILYPDYDKYSFNCIGSVGFAFQSLLVEVAGEYEMDVGKIQSSPMDGLVKFHL